MPRGRLAGRPYPSTHHTALGVEPRRADGTLTGGCMTLLGASPGTASFRSRSLPRHGPCEYTLPLRCRVPRAADKIPTPASGQRCSGSIQFNGGASGGASRHTYTLAVAKQAICTHSPTRVASSHFRASRGLSLPSLTKTIGSRAFLCKRRSRRQQALLEDSTFTRHCSEALRALPSSNHACPTLC